MYSRICAAKQRPVG